MNCPPNAAAAKTRARLSSFLTSFIRCPVRKSPPPSPSIPRPARWFGCRRSRGTWARRVSCFPDSNALSKPQAWCCAPSSAHQAPAPPPAPPKPKNSSRKTFCLWHSRSEEHTSELQSRLNLVCRLLLEKKKKQPEHMPSSHDQHRHSATARPRIVR